MGDVIIPAPPTAQLNTQGGIIHTFTPGQANTGHYITYCVDLDKGFDNLDIWQLFE